MKVPAEIALRVLLAFVALFLGAIRRRRPRRPTAKQRRFLKRLAAERGVDVPKVRTLEEASDAIDNLLAKRRRR